MGSRGSLIQRLPVNLEDKGTQATIYIIQLTLGAASAFLLMGWLWLSSAAILSVFFTIFGVAGKLILTGLEGPLVPAELGILPLEDWWLGTLAYALGAAAVAVLLQFLRRPIDDATDAAGTE